MKMNKESIQNTIEKGKVEVMRERERDKIILYYTGIKI